MSKRSIILFMIVLIMGFPVGMDFRAQDEKIDTIICLNLLKARVDSLEVMLRRAHVVVVEDSVYKATGFSVVRWGWEESDTVDSLIHVYSIYPDSTWSHKTRFEISFEPDFTKEEQ